jgi:predicted transcriptional regulator
MALISIYMEDRNMSYLKSEKISIRIKQSDKDALWKLAEELEEKPSDLIRQAIKEFIMSQEKNK